MKSILIAFSVLSVAAFLTEAKPFFSGHGSSSGSASGGSSSGGGLGGGLSSIIGIKSKILEAKRGAINGIFDAIENKLKNHGGGNNNNNNIVAAMADSFSGGEELSFGNADTSSFGNAGSVSDSYGPPSYNAQAPIQSYQPQQQQQQQAQAYQQQDQSYNQQQQHQQQAQPITVHLYTIQLAQPQHQGSYQAEGQTQSFGQAQSFGHGQSHGQAQSFGHGQSQGHSQSHGQAHGQAQSHGQAQQEQVFQVQEPIFVDDSHLSHSHNSGAATTSEVFGNQGSAVASAGSTFEIQQQALQAVTPENSYLPPHGSAY